MKTKVSQKEWNDKRDQFICALLSANKHSDYKQSISSGIGITEELYYVSETKEARPMTEEEKKANEHLKAVLKRDHLPPPFESTWKDSLQSNPQPTGNPNEQFTPCSFPPKEDASDALMYALAKGVEEKTGEEVVAIHGHIDGNTITATPEQLREWFPQAYENETSELVMLVKENYLAADGSIKKGILKDGNWYAPANDLYKNEGGENV
jgi:hypothetical protein